MDTGFTDTTLLFSQTWYSHPYKQEGIKKNEEVTQRQRKTEATGTSVPLVRFLKYSDN